MANFDDREKGFERKYVHDEETAFRAIARRNKLLGLWAAEKLGKKGDAAAAYAKEVIAADFEADGDQDVVDKLLKDFAAAHITLTDKDIRAEMERLLPIARQQVAGHT